MNCGHLFFFKQKTAYEVKECDWSSDVCSSDPASRVLFPLPAGQSPGHPAGKSPTIGVPGGSDAECSGISLMMGRCTGGDSEERKGGVEGKSGEYGGGRSSDIKDINVQIDESMLRQ